MIAIILPYKGMRYPVKHKEESRTRILQAAARQFRAEGAEAVRVSDVMEAAGLTHGGFYKHFTNKDHLLQEAVRAALDSVSDRIAAMTASKPRAEALTEVIAFYLSEEHMRHPDLGCALAALGTEMARFSPTMKREVSKALDMYADRLSYLMPGSSETKRKAAFRVLFPSMAGCLMTARAYSSRSVQQQILAGGRAFFTSAFCSTCLPMFEEVVQ